MILATASFISLIAGLVIGYRRGYREGSTHGYRVGKQFGNDESIARITFDNHERTFDKISGVN